jgi:magnesium-transporting ATPase (P-type)
MSTRSQEKQKFLRSNVSGISYNQLIDYGIILLLLYPAVANAYWANEIREQKGADKFTSSPYDTKSIAFVLTVLLSILSFILLVLLFSRYYMKNEIVTKNILIFFTLGLIIISSLLLREVYDIYRGETELGDVSGLDDTYLENSIISAVMGSCFVAIIVGCGIVFKEL